MDYPGNNLTPNGSSSTSAAKCQEKCQKNNKCVAFTWNSSTKKCLLKSRKSVQVTKSNLIAGDKFCGISNLTNYCTPFNNYFIFQLKVFLFIYVNPHI